MTLALEVFAAALLLFLVGSAATGRLGGLVEAHPDRADVGLPAGRLSPADASAATFTLAFRGYRMEEVDAALDRLVAELGSRDAEVTEKDAQIKRLEDELTAAQAPPPPPPPPPQFPEE